MTAPEPSKRTESSLMDQLIQRPDNLLTHSVLRYLGFVNDAGEACKSLLPKPLYYGTYLITGGYCVTDIILSKFRLEHKLGASGVSQQAQKELTTKKMIDTGIWHFFATLAVTPYLIHKSKTVSKRVLSRTSFSPNFKQTTGPAMIGLCLIPILVPPVDNLFHWVLNSTIRDHKHPYEWHGIYSFVGKSR